MADINPNISGSTVDPKWIDGGPENPEPTFNIDDPAFSLPMPVMSGLASGFCERAAVVYGGTVGGQPWDNATSAAKANAVSCLAANLALGTVPNASMTNMFVSANTDFMPTKYNTTSNYMKGLDNMLTKLISAPGGYVRNITGVTPAAFTFTTLANDAKSRSALPSVGSSATSVGSGGAAYTSRFMPALPVVYPIHRKWMLDELKYTAGQAVETRLEGDAAGNMSYISSASIADYRTTAQSAYDLLATDTHWGSYTVSPNIYYGLTIESATQDWRTSSYLMATPMSATLDAYYNLSQPEDENDPVTVEYSWIASNNQSDVATQVLTNGATVFVEVADALSEDVVADVYMEQAPAEATPTMIPATSEYVMSSIESSTTAVNNITLYKILSGGTLVVSSGTTINNAIIHSGGTLHINNGAYVSCCTVLSGGTIAGIKNIQTLNIDGMFVDATTNEDIAEPVGNLLHVIGSGQTVSINNDTAITGDTVGYYVSSGGSLVISATYKSMLFGNHRYETDTTLFPIGRIFVDSGGYVAARGTPDPYRLTVQNPTDEDDYCEYTRNLPGDIISGGSTEYCCWKNTSSSEETTALPDKLYTTVNISYIIASGAYGTTLYSSSTGTPTATSYEVIGSGTDYDAHLEIVCPVVVLSGGTFEQGLATTLGWNNEYAGSLEGMLVTYPGATFSLAMRTDTRQSTYSDGVLGSIWYTLHLSDETAFTLYRITTAATVNPWYLHVTGTAFIHVTDPVSTDFSIINITGATWSSYAESNTVYGVYGTTSTETGYNPSDNTYDMSRATTFDYVRLFVFNPLGLTTYISGSTGTSLVIDKNSIAITSSSLYGIRCRKKVSNTNVTALYYKSEQDHEWVIFGGSSTAWYWPDKLYTDESIPSRSDPLYDNAARTSLDGSTVYSFSYPLLTGESISLNDIPASGNDDLYGFGGSYAAVYYRCAITDIIIRVEGANQPISHYKEFRVRQFYEDPGKLY